MTQEKTPGAVGAATEGQNPEGNQMMDETVARQERALKARHGTIAANPHVAIEDTPTEPTFRDDPAADQKYSDPAEHFAAEELASMPLRFRTAPEDEITVWRGHDGTWYRHAGRVRIQPCADGVRRFVILLPEGATTDDVARLTRAVEDARAGRAGHTWKHFEDGQHGWADALTFSFAFTSQSYVDPYTHRDTSRPVTVCDEPLCDADWHDDYGTHQADSITRRLPENRGRYQIAVTRFVEPGSRWKVDVFSDEFFGTPEDVAGFVSDLQWMSETCRRANSGAVERPERMVA